MHSISYLDLVYCGKNGGYRKPGQTSRWISKVMSCLHAYFKQHGFLPVDFPKYQIAGPEIRSLGNTVRVFARSSEMVRLKSYLEGQRHLLDDGRLKDIMACPLDTTSWVRCYRFRVLGRQKIAGITESAAKEKAQATRYHNIMNGNNLPWFFMRSSTNKHDFSCSVIREETAAAPEDQTEEQRSSCLTSYGLSKKEMPLWMPNLP